MRALSDGTVTNLVTALILAGFVISLIAVPHEWLQWISVGFLAFSISAVVGIRAYCRRLEAVRQLIAANPRESAEDFLVVRLTSIERTLLRLPLQRGSDANALLRNRQAILLSLGMAIAMPGICAFLLVIYFFAD